MKVITHNSAFHPDDVFAVAVLFLRFGEMEVLRTREEEKFKEADFLVDVGGVYNSQERKFDHHQKGGAGKRENGAPYASFGLVWKEYGKEICGDDESVKNLIDSKIVSYIDLMDNGNGELKESIPGVFPYTIGMAILAFNSTWKDVGKEDENFLHAVKFAKELLEREIKNSKDEILGMTLAKEAYENSLDKRIIILEGEYPWEFIYKDYPEPIYVIKPNKANQSWEITAVRDNPYSFKNRKDMPKEWAGKRNEELVEQTGVKDAIFAHNGLFFAVAKTKEGAIKLAEKAIEN